MRSFVIKLLAHGRRHLIAYVALAVALGGTAYAATSVIPDPSGRIHACYKNANGDLRVVTQASDCRHNETALDWNQRGPAGQPGSPGPPGPPGTSSSTLRYAAVSSQASTNVDAVFTSAQPADLGGPSVTVDVPAHGIVEIWALATARHDCPNGGCGNDRREVLYLHDDAQPTVKHPMANGLGEPNGTWVTLSVGLTAFDNSYGPEFPAPQVLTPPAGRHTYSLRYSSSQGATATFKDRQLWVRVSTPAS